jgi:cobaltochelatase CobS
MAKKQHDDQGNERIRCEICGNWYHQLPVHLSKAHKTSVEQYLKAFPEHPTVSEYARERMAQAKLGQPNHVTPRQAVQPPNDGSNNGAQHLYFGTSMLVVQDGLDEFDGEHVPSHDANYKFWNKEALEGVATGIELDLNLLMVGPTGCGKTSMVEELAALLNQPTKRINLDGDVRSSDFLGQMKITVDQDSGQAVTEWEDGILPTAMRRGWWLILDEMDAAPAQILMTLQAVLEHGHKLVLKENGGEIVKAHPRFRLIATANTLGRGDQSGMYAGTNVLNEATLDRFGIVIQFGYPGASQEVSIVRAKTGVDAAIAKKMCEVAKKVRAGLGNDECYCTFSTRRVLNWAALTVKLGDQKKAAQFAVLQRLSDEDRVYVAGVIQRVMGGY